jgi:hypothetical protein
MELVTIDTSKVIHLHVVHRPEGQVYAPDLIREVIGRYSFLKYPTPEEILRREIKLEIGKFKNAQIQELAVFGDGIIVSSASDTDILIEFIDDLWSLAQLAFGMIPMITNKPETYFESTILVKSRVDLTSAAAPKSDIRALLDQSFHQASAIAGKFVPSGFIYDTEVQTFPGRRKPMQFTVERRIGVPFDENVFFCRAPLPTKVHLKVLGSIESVLLDR